MKFKKAADEIQYKILKMDEAGIRKKIRINTKRVDRKKSRTMRDHWRRNKNSLKKGIKKWHKSTQGKRFHRALGRFNALREGAYLYSYYYNEAEPTGKIKIDLDGVNQALLSLSSIETHLFLELQYYEGNPDTLSEFLTIVYQFVDDASFLKASLLEAYVSGEILGENYILLNDIIQFFQNPKSYTYEKRTALGLSNDENSLDESELELLKKQLEFVENLDLTEPGNEIYEKIDELVQIK